MQLGEIVCVGVGEPPPAGYRGGETFDGWRKFLEDKIGEGVAKKLVVVEPREISELLGFAG